MRQLPRCDNREMAWKDYRRLKRRQLRALLRAMDDLADGSAFLPPGAYAAFLDATRAARKLADVIREQWPKG